jgi:hypothetical protein
LSWPITLTRMPPSNMGWQSVEVTMWAMVCKEASRTGQLARDKKSFYFVFSIS